MKKYLPILYIVAVLITGGCTKSDLQDLITNYHKVILYNDTLPDPRNQAIRIVAGNNRLFMNYCYDFERFDIVNGVFITPPDPRNQWMLTDIEGNIIRRDSFLTGLTMGDVMFLSDNRIMAILYNAHEGTSGVNYEIMFFLFDQNGNKITGDTLFLPAGITLAGPPYDNHQLIHLTQSISGNALMYFEYYDVNYNAKSFAGELNSDGSFSWYNIYSEIKISGGIRTSDGGYIFTGSDPGGYYNYLPGYVFVMKTTATGDSSWAKTFNVNNPLGGQITTGDNGNYFFCFSDVNFFVYEINAAGDSLNSFVINENGLDLPAALVPKNGGVFTLLNQDVMSYLNLTYQVNTHFISLDAGLDVTQKGKFQKENSDMIFAACKNSDGKIACFGITQIYNRPYYKPELIIVN